MMDETLLKIPNELPDHLPTELLSLALDGLLAPDEQQRFETHLGACELCSGEWLKWRQIASTLQTEPFAPPPAGFMLRVDQAIRRNEQRRERMAGALLLVGGTVAIMTVLVMGLVLVLALSARAFPDTQLGLLAYVDYGGQAVALIFRNLAAIRDGLLALLPGPGILAAVGLALMVLSLVWLRLVRSAGRRSVASGQQASSSNQF